MITIKEAEEILKKEYHLDNYEYLIGEILLPDYKKEEARRHFAYQYYDDKVFVL